VPQEWIPSAPANSWRWIVIHHSATPAGSAALIDRAHRAQGWDEMGYHFVIGNGTASRDGQIEVGTRWPKQKWGAHAKTPDQQYNNFGIGICLVGNFDIDRPSAAQLRSVAKLTAYLMRTYHIPANHVIGHSDTKATDCPGRHMSVADIRRLASQLAQDTGTAAPTQTASAELLRPITTP
jgi:N-acetyl-anhydromuramyl-L-alanine amidase AmpD